MCGEHHGAATARIITRTRGDIDTSPSPSPECGVSAPVTDFCWLLQFSQAAVYCLVMTSTGHSALTDYTCTQFAFILLLLSEVVVHTVNFIYLVSMPIRSKRLHRVSLLSAGACNGVHLKLQHSVAMFPWYPGPDHGLMTPIYQFVAL